MRRGFSMIELVIVIVIIGIISAIAIPRFSRAAQTASFNATQSSLVGFEKQMFLYEATYADFPPNGKSGLFDPCMSEFIRESDWTTKPPIGGQWLWTNDGPILGVGIEDGSAPTALWLAFDATFDDGKLDTGILQAPASQTLYRLLTETSARAASASEAAALDGGTGNIRAIDGP